MDFNYIYDVQGNCSVIDLIKWKISDKLDWMGGIWGDLKDARDVCLTEISG